VLLRTRCALALSIYLVVILLSSLLIGAAIVILVTQRGEPVALEWPEAVEVLGRMTALSGLAVACGLLLPSPGAAFGVFIAVALFGDILASRLGAAAHWISFSASVDSLTDGSPSSFFPLFTAFVVWIGMPIAIGAWIFARADINAAE
jgi:hypothetical protein